MSDIECLGSKNHTMFPAWHRSFKLLLTCAGSFRRQENFTSGKYFSIVHSLIFTEELSSVQSHPHLRFVSETFARWLVGKTRNVCSFWGLGNRYRRESGFNLLVCSSFLAWSGLLFQKDIENMLSYSVLKLILEKYLSNLINIIYSVEGVNCGFKMCEACNFTFENEILVTMTSRCKNKRGKKTGPWTMSLELKKSPTQNKFDHLWNTNARQESSTVTNLECMMHNKEKN